MKSNSEEATDARQNGTVTDFHLVLFNLAKTCHVSSASVPLLLVLSLSLINFQSRCCR